MKQPSALQAKMALLTFVAGHRSTLPYGRQSITFLSGTRRGRSSGGDAMRRTAGGTMSGELWAVVNCTALRKQRQRK